MKLSNILNYFFADKLSIIWKNQRIRKALALAVFFSVTFLTLFSSFVPQQVSLRTDEVSKNDIVSEINAVVVDEKQTAELRQQAASRVQKIYQEDNYALVNARDEVSGIYASIKEVLENKESNRKDSLQKILKAANNLNHPLNVDYKDLTQYLLNATLDDLEQMETATQSMVDQAMEKPITDEALEGTYNEITLQINQLGFASEAEDIIRLIVIKTVRANMIYDQETTERAMNDARNMVKPVQKNIKAGEIIVREGERVSAEQISVLEQLGIQRSKSYSLTLIGTILFILLLFFLLLEYTKYNHRKVYNDEKLLLLLGLIFVLIILLSRLVTIVEIPNRPNINAMTGYLAPVAAGSMLIAILIDGKLAYFMTVIMAVFVGMMFGGNQLAYTTVAMISGTIGVFRVSSLSQTSDLARSGLYLAGANIISIITMALIIGKFNLNLAILAIIIGTVSGLLSAILMIGVLPYLESAFSITSMIRLLELSNPNQYLLKRLLLEAPGTYHHSLMVGNLAEAAAEAVGANSLLVRVGAYYHDIGKIKRPEYFVENQQGIIDPHAKIAPALSALIITSHVKEGLELARDKHLPQSIIEFITGHHGTSLTKYFYSRALEEDGGEHINEENFRYEGPKPQSKEVALVMLADAAEAAVRSISDPTNEKIRDMVRKIIRDKLNDGQLEECDLTFRDLDIIAATFVRVLEGIYHRRIEYPDIIAEELTRRRV
ncbi:MAG TPA: HDIG domain-containing protein [Syntrophomonas sp.]|nr:HDIG domain-containing protein [Syntrophomonas sp.]HPT68897.1 HDIG domain-containing protein [Syntrophomonas sp.]